MRRATLLFAAGLLLGALAMYLARSDDPAVPTATSTLPSATAPEQPGRAPSAPRAIDFLELVTGSIDVSERAALYRLAAEADRAMLASLVAQVATLPKLPSRALALEVLLTRYAEIDAPAAAALARELELEAAVIAPLFAAWARRDSSAALEALRDLDAATATTLGIALLQTVGNDDLGIIRVLGAAPQIDADRFRLEAAVAKAETSPEDATADALLLPASKSAAALGRIAAIWARSDVHGAVAYLDSIEDERLRNEFKAAVLREWAGLDPEGLLTYVRGLAAAEQDDAVPGALQALAMIEPARALEAAAQMTGELGSMVRRVALMTLARDDPLGALRHAEALPVGGERDQVMSAIANAYGRLDPAAAVAWAQSVASPGVLASVLSGVAGVDPDRAIELVFTLTRAEEQERLLRSIVMSSAMRGEHTAALADRLVGQPSRTPALQMLTNIWAQRAPEEALRWLLANPGDAAPSAIARAGMSLARNNPAAAIGYLDRVPSELRANWISAVAEGYAQNDPRAAANWLTQYRGEPGYDAATAAVASRTARHDPVGAARLFDSVDLAQAPDAAANVRNIAASWAGQEPQAAAAWARQLGDDDVATAVIAVVANQWVARDVGAARNWTMSLPAGAARDAALVQIVGATTGTAAADPALLEAFSSPAAQQRAVNEAVRIVAGRDADAARQLADQYLTDPGLRRAAERFIDQGGSSGPMIGPPTPRVPATR